MSKRHLTLISTKSTPENVEKRRKSSDESNNEMELQGTASVESYLKNLIAFYNREPDKLRKEDLWETSKWKNSIEIFSQYSQHCSNTDVIDFQTAGSALLVASECYAIKVDSLHKEALHLASMFRRCKLYLFKFSIISFFIFQQSIRLHQNHHQQHHNRYHNQKMQLSNVKPLKRDQPLRNHDC